MTNIIPPTHHELSEEELECVDHRSDDSWRHGSNVTDVFHRTSDDTYWEAKYKKSGDGETNGLYDGHVTITRVYPIEVMTIKYVKQP